MDHVIELKKVDGGWFFEIDREANHGGCGTKPTLEEALASAATMIPRIEDYAKAQPEAKSMMCAPLNAQERP